MGRMAEAIDARYPLQGGLPAGAAVTGRVVEIACDESGFSGSNLLDPATPVFTHASVDLSPGEARDVIATLRTGFRFSLDEFKSGKLLRGEAAGESRAWFLTTMAGRAHVQVVDKEYFLVTRMVDFLVSDPSYAAGTRLTQDLRPAALSLYRAGRQGGPTWDELLAAFVDLVRTKRRRRPDRDVVERFFRARDRLAAGPLGGSARTVLNAIERDRVWAVVSRLLDDERSIPPPLEPLLPALAETVLFWSGGHRQVLVTHDEQSALTADRLTRLQQVLAGGLGRSPLAGLVCVDSRDDARVQVADLLAGVARRSAMEGDLDGLGSVVSPTSLHDPCATRRAGGPHADGTPGPTGPGVPT